MIFVLLFSLLIDAGSATLLCPYPTEITPIANDLSQCLHSSGAEVSARSVLECMTGFTLELKQFFTSILFSSIANQIHIKTNEYEMCSDNFNKILDTIIKTKPNIVLNNTSTRSKVKKLITDSISYQNYYCDNLELQKVEEYERQMQKTKARHSNLYFDMYVYSANDFVSSSIISEETWKTNEVNAILNALSNYRKKHNIDNPNEVLFLDIGAQIGWHSLVAAYYGYKVVAFEPMDKNQYIFRHSICLNRSLDIININKGIGHEERVCHLYSHKINEGDPKVFCDTSAAYKNYTNRGTMETLRLDDFANYFKNLAVIKIDIKGGEHLALEGGRKVFLEMKVPYIVTEFAPKMLRDVNSDPIAYFQELADAGYSASRREFNDSQKVTIDDIREFSDITKPGYTNLIVDLFFTHKDA